MRTKTTFALWAVLCLVACAGEDAIGSESSDATEATWTCDGTVGTKRPTDGGFYVTSFGCWIDEDGNPQGDSDDNCIPYCMGHAPERYDTVCEGLSGPECERQVKWFTADAHRFGCMTRVKVTNPQNGKAAVLLVLDAGPHCDIEDTVDHWVLDVSYPASDYLFGEPKAATEKGEVIVEAVHPNTPLGPTDLPPFVGDTCAGHDDCAFTVGAEQGSCTLHDPSGGYCTVGCEGYCEDQAGKATTFCVSFDGANGQCAPKPSPFNNSCDALPHTELRQMERFIGTSDATPKTDTVCAPVGW